jgi:short-subunit dehydrogenase
MIKKVLHGECNMPEFPIPPATPLTPRRRAVLIGASRGIGAALARKLAREGYTLALLARGEELLETLCAEINRECGETRAIYYVHDVTDHQSVPELLKRILIDLGGLDLFIYNSGISLPPGLKHFDAEKDRQTTEVNYLGALAWRCFVPKRESRTDCRYLFRRGGPRTCRKPGV